MVAGHGHNITEALARELLGDGDPVGATLSSGDGSGSYTIGVYKQNPSTGKYATQLSKTLSVKLNDEFAPFLRPNQYVNYSDASACAETRGSPNKAATAGCAATSAANASCSAHCAWVACAVAMSNAARA